MTLYAHYIAVEGSHLPNKKTEEELIGLKFRPHSTIVAYADSYAETFQAIVVVFHTEEDRAKALAKYQAGAYCDKDWKTGICDSQQEAGVWLNTEPICMDEGCDWYGAPLDSDGGCRGGRKQSSHPVSLKVTT